jgi:(p)ppGpp synthase/HD superfamily hydrolase
MIEQALLLAYTHHNRQIDKSGHPILMHLLAVAGHCSTEIEMTVALLHDLVEDTPVTLPMLQQMFPKDVVEAVDHLTRRDGEEYIEQYIERVMENHLAAHVKVRDLVHHLRQEEASNIPHSLRGRYRRAYHKITGCYWDEVKHLPD